MPLIADLFQVFILITCLIGIGLFGKLALPEAPFSLHFCFAPLALVAVLFCLEHYLPLGQMPWLWVPGSLLSLVLIRAAGKNLVREPVLWYFLTGFAVCFFWRFSFPDIYPISEMLPDDAHLVSYSAGGQLPAEDVWMKGTRDDSYYILQYYAAGLIHRWMGCGPGMTYQLGYCVLVAIGIAAAGAGVAAATRSAWAGSWATIFLALGGVGTTLLTPFTSPNYTPSPLSAMRFVGSYAVINDKPSNYMTPFGTWLLQHIGVSNVDAPIEYYSYITMLGDFHPSLSSLAFFGLVILAIGVAERAVPGSTTDRFCVTGAISTAIFILVSNTWITPLQVALVVAWLVYRWWNGRGVCWTYLLGSVLVSFALIFPYFSQFAYETRNYPIRFEWVPERPPFLNWFVVMFPACLMWFATLWTARTEPLARFAAIVGIGAMIGTYFFYIHDIYGGVFAVFNTTLKWWPWVYALVFVLGLMSIWPHRILRNIGYVILLLTLVGNIYIFGLYWHNTSKEHMGRLDGYAWFTEANGDQKSIYQQLQALPKGVVMESVVPNTADTGASLALFTGHYSLGGYTGHEKLWREAREDIDRLAENRDKFYNGTLDNAASWLRGIVPGGVTYIVWLNRDNERGLGIWSKINDAIKDDYDWRSTYEYNQGHWGMWVSKNRGSN